MVMEKKVCRILLTVPHGCSEKTPVCDENADLIAKRTADLLGCADLYIYRGNRKRLDGNRRGSRLTEFRRNIKEFNKKFDSLVLDIHSFPPEYESWKDYEVVVFDLSTKKDDTLVKKFVDELNRLGLKTGIAKGSNKNDVVYTTTKGGDLGILFEFRDDLDVEKVSEKFVDSIKNVLEI
jgi:hypothetical protein